MEYPGKKRLNMRFAFTQLPFINRYMLFWSLVGTLLACLLHRFTAAKKTPLLANWEAFTRWLLQYGLFMVFYMSFNVISGSKETDFDPSGHLTCSLLAQAGHASYYLLFTKQSEDDSLKRVLLYIFAFFQLHACYSLFFTALIYHTVVETCIGWLFGMAIAILTYETDLLKDCMLTIIGTPKAVLSRAD